MPLPRSAPLLAILAASGTLSACRAAPPEVGCLEDPALEAYAIAFTGSDLGAWEGRQVVLRTTMPMALTPDASCPSRAAVTIDGGAFALTLEGRSDGAAYPTVGAFVDLDGDGLCDAADEPAWSSIVAVAPGGTLPIAVGAEELAIAADGSGCGEF